MEKVRKYPQNEYRSAEAADYTLRRLYGEEHPLKDEISALKERWKREVIRNGESNPYNIWRLKHDGTERARIGLDLKEYIH